jgi:hypothetical protein
MARPRVMLCNRGILVLPSGTEHQLWSLQLVIMLTELSWLLEYKYVLFLFSFSKKKRIYSFLLKMFVAQSITLSSDLLYNSTPFLLMKINACSQNRNCYQQARACAHTYICAWVHVYVYVCGLIVWIKDHLFLCFNVKCPFVYKRACEHFEISAVHLPSSANNKTLTNTYNSHQISFAIFTH